VGREEPAARFLVTHRADPRVAKMIAALLGN
jgi:hypothetical protein